MKKGIVYITLFFSLFIYYFSLNHRGFYSKNNLIGHWEGKVAGKEFSLIFKEDSTCLITLFDEVSESIRQISGDYELNYAKKPISLNIKNIPELPHPLYSILHFIKNDSIKMSEFSPRWRVRPISFDYKSDILLRRINKIQN